MVLPEAGIKELVDRWTNCTLPAKEWTHEAHVSTCSYFAWQYTLAETYSLMKAGLYKFNQATGVPNTDNRGYHETLTRFWVTMLFFEIHRRHYNSCEAAVHAMVELYGGNSRAEQSYYSFDVLRSREARRVWIAPDLAGGIAREAFHW
jgi:hypothetical protein